MSTQQQPLNIAIVGAGIAGLAAAIALRRNGHIVQIYESDKYKTEIGAGLGVTVNAQRVLEELGYTRENLKGVVNEGALQFDGGNDGEGELTPWLLESLKNTAKPQNILCARTDLHAELERLALGDGAGPPAVLHLSSTVLKCDPEAGSLTLSDGTVVQSDLILGADGIASSVRTDIVGHHVRPMASGLTCYRAVIEAAQLEGSEGLEWLNEGTSGPRSVRMKVGGLLRGLIIYPCRNGTLFNVVGVFMDLHQDDPDWKASGTRAEVQQFFADFHGRYQPVFAAFPEQVPKWRMLTLPHLPTWVRARAALVGDAAHGTLPMFGQGAALAIEDAAALRALLPPGTAPADVPARLAAYEALRKPRCDYVVRESVMGPNKAKWYPSRDGDIVFASPEEQQAYLMEYDATKVAEEYYRENFGQK
ncbi:FAD/NAD(P)-binding domain-containing protein [Mycena maculata]|uniref:FAD/NAD(P)-binding domain-containing protein n=1 Tax=Mycena maculata TaxID=230809 RepID=A0AAD7I1H4_9AGAR|nr:FAD/NAD(P)-binding domain-containing protein [Mycena maculata]